MGRSASRSRDGAASNGKDKGGDGKREKGTINTWNNDRQFGFVSCDSGRQDLFTHAEYITDTNARYDAKTRGLRRGDRIAFDVEEPQGSKKSMQAVNVEILDLVKRSRSPSRRRSRSRGRGGGGGGRGRSRSRGRNTRPKEQRAGDWECPKCGDYQFARNTECRKCGAKPRSARSDSRKPAKRGDSRRRSPPPRRRSNSRRSDSRRRRSPGR
ncbi:unnamed protein product [Cladocopium goreaui]|uniref:RanBP2-type domain-containing protein n=1 Tax=Cladocopium goreaui TaxID=2562237 RepID=A0A9P1DRZ6_9DINO|nr:unnamed protein product [Cladocopium goreaui]